jgi:FtsP/CotA-like multicopper oxidase with cupredoxin domain
MLNRRKFLKYISTAPILSLIPGISLGSDKTITYKILAKEGKRQLGPQKSNLSSLWLYNGITPGPIIRAKKGQELIVEFTNNLTQPTTIHWHGIRNLNKMDGVPGLTQSAVEPGETFTYRFPTRDAGTFWYHAHNKAWEQVARGLYGPLIIEELDSSINARDRLIVADDWRLTPDYQIEENTLGSLRDWSHQGRIGNWLTINGKSKPEISLPVGFVRLRLINTANARTLAFEFGNTNKFEVIALDGASCKPFILESIKLGPAQRADILLNYSGDEYFLYEVATGKRHEAAKLVPSRVTPEPIKLAKEIIPWYPTPSAGSAKIINIHMQGGAMGNLSSAYYLGEKIPLRELAQKHSKLWALNNKIGGYNEILAALSLGDVAILRVWNDTRWKHSMHLHGHHFWVTSKEFSGPDRKVLRDTYLMLPNEKADFLFVADNPGQWLFHCHMLEHHASGMGGVIKIT